MKCAKCDKSNVLNRVIVNQLTGHEHGLFCEACEADVFGELLENPAWHQKHGCAFCDNDGRFALPRLDCLIEHGDGSPRHTEHEPIENAVRLCEHHVDELLPPDKTIKRKIEA